MRWYVLAVWVGLALGLAPAAMERSGAVDLTSGTPCPSRPSTTGFVEDGNLRVWYGNNGKPTAQRLLRTLKTVQQRLAFLPPPLQDSISCNDGGSPHVDFYLVATPRPSFWDPKDDATSVFILPPAAEQVTGFVELDRGLTGLDLGCAAAHAYFHLAQGRYGFPSIRKNLWWYEATADYAEFTFDQKCPLPHGHADFFLNNNTRHPFELLSAYPTNYGTWLWPLYMQSKRPGFVKSVFEKLGATGGDATDAIPSSTWVRDFPDFALREYNYGIVNDFSKLHATNEVVKYNRLDANLNGDAVSEIEMPVKVYPTAARHVLIDLLDVDTRFAKIDLSDFADDKNIHIKVLRQPTKGPDPAARAAEWDDATIEDWTGVREKFLCRDEEKDDSQQILLAISNDDPDSRPVRGTISVRSEAFCQWKVSGQITVKGAPPGPTSRVAATGAYGRSTIWTLNPEDDPEICPQPDRACLPLTGRMQDAVTWKADAHIIETEPGYEAAFDTHVEASGSQSYTFDDDPSGGDLPQPALFQEMVWDEDAKEFRPVVSIMFSNYNLFGGTLTHRTPAPNAHWEASGSGACDRTNGEPDYVYTASNVHGRVGRVWTSCLEKTESYGVNRPLYFDGFGLPNGALPKPGNHGGDSICDKYSLFAPWTATSGGPCWRVNFDPYPTFATRMMGFTGTGAPPPAQGSAFISEEFCKKKPEPCPVTSSELGSEHDDWPQTITVRITLRKAPDR